MRKITIAAVFFMFSLSLIQAQPRLKIEPDELEFEDIFNRLGVVYFKNIGNQPLSVDSIYYNLDYYFVRYDRYSRYPFIIEPGDSVQMDCILSGFFSVTSADTLDTLYVFNSGYTEVEHLKIKIDFYDDDQGDGIINGQVRDSSGAGVPGANVYFFYNGNYAIRTAITDQFGFFSELLPEGRYTLAAEKQGYYTSFYDQQYDPLNATVIELKDDSIRTAYISLLEHIQTGNGVTGLIIDSIAGASVNKGVVVVRRGTHTPTKIPNSPYASLADRGIYTTFIKEGGTYSIDNIITPGYYYIQSFSDYFLPGYYTDDNTASNFWQTADTINIEQSLTNISVNMLRDSSFGGGTVLGTISTGGENILSDVVIYAQSVDNQNPLFTYAFMERDGKYNLKFLPYGTYRLVAQRIGLEDAYSETFTIDPLNTLIPGIDMTFLLTGIDEENPEQMSFTLSQNYPNPFNPSTIIRYTLSEASPVSIKVYDMLGREIAFLVNGEKPAGTHEVIFNASGLSSGVYFYRLEAGRISETRKMILMR